MLMANIAAFSLIRVQTVLYKGYVSSCLHAALVFTLYIALNLFNMVFILVIFAHTDNDEFYHL